MVEDNRVDALFLQAVLSKAGVEKAGIETAGCLNEALCLILEKEFDVILLDLSLPDAEGLETVRKTHMYSLDVPIIVLTGTDDEEIGIESVKAGAEDYLIKGKIDGPLLVRSIRYAIERHRLIEEIRSLMMTDELTGLYNRRGFLTLAQHQLQLARRTGKEFQIFYADLDGLKAINDSLGHRAGDEALVRIAKVLRESFRSTDIIARLGGDEFTVMAIAASYKDADLLSANINKRLDEANEELRDGYKLSLSYGIASYSPGSDETIEQLLLRADKALYERKSRKLLRADRAI
ncbi:MAG TPA: GGDEF domain-containing response regulator, partial [Blastocatellia bacterium]|nr:GGDEF domain-containing response regulator [Blastocatellia bacterium]